MGYAEARSQFGQFHTRSVVTPISRRIWFAEMRILASVMSRNRHEPFLERGWES